MHETKRKKRLSLLAAVLLFVALICGLLLQIQPSSTATLTIETPQKVSLSTTETLELDVSITALGEARYPAMSASIRFDPSRLEFLGLGEGNVTVLDAGSSSGYKLPEWSCNVALSNEIGQINLMYLDLTGGKHAFDKSLLADNDNVVVRLNFRLRGSVRNGDICELIVDDAVFAASDETQSLAMTTGTLRAKNSKIVIGE